VATDEEIVSLAVLGRSPKEISELVGVDVKKLHLILKAARDTGVEMPKFKTGCSLGWKSVRRVELDEPPDWKN
jgi:hypothetical protein